MSNAVSLFGNAIPGNQEPDEEIVARLEYLLERARAGLITGLAHASVENNGWTDYGVLGKCNWAMMIGAVARLNHRMLKRDAED